MASLFIFISLHLTLIMLREGKQKTDLRYRKIGEPNSHNKSVLLLPTSLAYNWQPRSSTSKKQTKAKKKEETLLTTRGVKCALAATRADVEHGCGVKCVTQEEIKLKKTLKLGAFEFLEAYCS